MNNTYWCPPWGANWNLLVPTRGRGACHTTLTRHRVVPIDDIGGPRHTCHRSVQHDVILTSYDIMYDIGGCRCHVIWHRHDIVMTSYDMTYDIVGANVMSYDFVLTSYDMTYDISGGQCHVVWYRHDIVSALYRCMFSLPWRLQGH